MVQRNLVYVVGLSLDICNEETLQGPEHFGAYGKVFKVRQLGKPTIKTVLFGAK